LVFPDNTVLINLAYIDALELITLRTATEVAWCASVADECRRSSDYTGLEALKTAHGILGDPLYPTPGERVDTQIIRRNMSSPGDSATDHLGEAETIAIITGRGIEAVFVTDDRDATLIAQTGGIKVVSTWVFLRLAVKLSVITPEDFWNHCQTLDAKGRGWPPCERSRAAVDVWLQES
jgi:predicted nucleic acid-binding protein